VGVSRLRLSGGTCARVKLHFNLLYLSQDKVFGLRAHFFLLINLLLRFYHLMLRTLKFWIRHFNFFDIGLSSVFCTSRLHNRHLS
jgi:hypothetical protein